MSDVSVAASAVPQSRRIAVTATVMLAALMQTLDSTIANVALPHIQGNLSATPEQANWVLTSYIVAAAMATPAASPLENIFGRKALFIGSVTGFVAASMLCGLATSLEQMILFRLLQGLFGAPLVPLAQAVLLDVYPVERRGSAMAIFGLGVMLGPIIGPTLGGWLTEYYSWRWVFYINIPVGGLAVLGLLLFLDEPLRGLAGRFDLLGFALLVLAIGALQMFLDRGEQLDWFASTEILIEAGVCVLSLYLFLVHSMTRSDPFIDRSLFGDRNFVIGLILIFAIGAILLATVALITPFLERLLNYSVLEAGLVLAPRGFGTMAAMLLVGPLIDRIGSRPLLIAGLLITAYALHEMAGYNLYVSPGEIVRTGVIQGFGLGLVFVPLSTATFATLPQRARTQGTALFSLVRNVGSSIGISLTTVLLIRTSTMVHASLAENITPFRPGAQTIAHAFNLATPQGRFVADLELTRQAMSVGYTNSFQLMMWGSLALVPIALLLRESARPLSRR